LVALAAFFEEQGAVVGLLDAISNAAEWERLHMMDDGRRMRDMDGRNYAIQPIEVIDMMRRYEVALIRETQ
jgi:hypothetical protein